MRSQVPCLIIIIPVVWMTTPWTIGCRSISNRQDPIPIGGLLLLAKCIDWCFLKPIAADNGYRLAPSMIYCSANSPLYLFSEHVGEISRYRSTISHTCRKNISLSHKLL